LGKKYERGENKGETLKEKGRKGKLKGMKKEESENGK
jgi:hypothetical protein